MQVRARGQTLSLCAIQRRHVWLIGPNASAVSPPHTREFVRTAWDDIERFKEQKNKDLREALVSYAIMQISMCKKVEARRPSVLTTPRGAAASLTSCSISSQGIQVWSNAKECFSKM